MRLLIKSRVSKLFSKNQVPSSMRRWALMLIGWLIMSKIPNNSSRWWLDGQLISNYKLALKTFWTLTWWQVPWRSTDTKHLIMSPTNKRILLYAMCSNWGAGAGAVTTTPEPLQRQTSCTLFPASATVPAWNKVFLKEFWRLALLWNFSL